MVGVGGYKRMVLNRGFYKTLEERIRAAVLCEYLNLLHLSEISIDKVLGRPQLQTTPSFRPWKNV